MEIRVSVVQHLAEASGTGRNGNQWTKREFVGETYDQYPRKIVFTIFNRKDDIPKLPDVGSDILVDFDLESNAWNTRDGQERWSTSVKVYSIKPGSAANPAPSEPAVPDTSIDAQPAPAYNNPQPQYQVPQVPQPAPPAPANNDDLPF